MVDESIWPGRSQPARPGERVRVASLRELPMKLMRMGVALVLVSAWTTSVLAQQGGRGGFGRGGPGGNVNGEMRAVTQAVIEEIDKNSELMSNLEYLCDMIGPRLTG